MESRDLKTLLAVIRCGSFTAAAAELGYTQSAVSQQIATLERELGQALLARRPVRPTPAGERLAEHAARILLRLEVAESEVRAISNESATLTVGAGPLSAPRLLAAALAEIRSSQRSCRVVVRTLDRPTAVLEVARGGADIALVDGITAPGQPLQITNAPLFSASAIAEDRLAVALAADHPLRRRARIDLAALADAPWVTPFPASNGLRPLLVEPGGRGVRYEGQDLHTTLALVAAGLGAALVPLAMGGAHDGVVEIPLRGAELVHRTEMITLRSPSPRCSSLVGAIRAESRLR